MDGSGRSGGSGRVRPPLRSPNPPLAPSSGEPVPLEVGLAALSLASHSEGAPVVSEREDLSPPAFDDATPPASYHNSFKPSTSNYVVPPKFPDPKIKQEVRMCLRCFTLNQPVVRNFRNKKKRSSQWQYFRIS